VETEKSTALQAHVAELDAQLMTQTDQYRNSIKQLQQKDEQVVALRHEVELVHDELEKKTNFCKNYELQSVRLQAELKEEKKKFAVVDEQLKAAHSDFKELSSQFDARETEMDRLTKSAEETEKVMNATVEQLTEVKTALTERVRELDTELKKVRSRCEELERDKDDVEAILKAKNSAVNDLAQKRLEVEREKTELKSELDQLKDTWPKEKNALEEFQKLLMSQKEQTEAELIKIQEEKELTERESEQEQAKLRVEVASLQSQVKETSDAKTALEHTLDDLKSKHDTEISALSGNLASLRTVLEEHKEKIDGEKKISHKLRGDVAVLEASIQNFQDERRSLLERCVNNEDEIQKLRGHVANMKCRLEESHGALQELGRENASLQVHQTLKMGRKWADDKVYRNCCGCQAEFTVSVRKHHCRNCGLIFCNDCSARTFQLSSYKKPARVCNSCYKELTG
jgi:early endosome antigen 1